MNKPAKLTVDEWVKAMSDPHITIGGKRFKVRRPGELNPAFQQLRLRSPLKDIDFSSVEKRIVVMPPALAMPYGDNTWETGNIWKTHADSFSAYHLGKPHGHDAFFGTTTGRLHHHPGEHKTMTTIPELKLDNGFVIPAVEITDKGKFLAALKLIKVTKPLCPQLASVGAGIDSHALGRALDAVYGHHGLHGAIVKYNKVEPSTEALRAYRAEWIEHAIKALAGRNYLLCRRVNDVSAKMGDEVYLMDGTRHETVKFVCRHPERTGYTIVQRDGVNVVVRNDDVRHIPLIWVDGAPVYSGDTLYYATDPGYIHNDGSLKVRGVKFSNVDKALNVYFTNGATFPVVSATTKVPIIGKGADGYEVSVGLTLYFVGEHSPLKPNSLVNVLRAECGAVTVTFPDDGRQYVVNLYDLSATPAIELEGTLLKEGDEVYLNSRFHSNPKAGAPLTVKKVANLLQLVDEGGMEIAACVSNVSRKNPFDLKVDGVLVKVGDVLWIKESGVEVHVKELGAHDQGVRVTSPTQLFMDGFISVETLTRTKPPKFIEINGHKVPEPMREAPEMGTKFYYPALFGAERFHDSTWRGVDWQHVVLAAGGAHLTKEAAVAHAQALRSFTELK